MKKVANFVLFQAGWFACVLSVERPWAWAALGFVGVCLLLHLAWIADDVRREVLALAILPTLGVLLDSALAGCGALQYRGAALFGVLAPVWILALWAIFVTTFHSSMSWMQGRYRLAAAFAALGAPLSYAGAARTGAVSFGEPLWRSVLCISLAWGLAMPLFLWIGVQLGTLLGAGRAQSPKAA